MEKLNTRSFMNWSSGKDAAFSLFKILKEKKLEIRYLFTTLNKANHRISMHGVREDLLQEQARQIGIPLKKLYLPENAGMSAYNQLMGNKMEIFKKENIRYSIFGDIFLEDLKKYREDQLKPLQMEAVFPLWKKNTTTLVQDFLNAGFKAVITCVNANLLDKSFAGKILDHHFLKALPPNVDSCGENGEFHTFVFDGPIFKDPVKFKTGEIVEKSYAPSDNAQWDNRFYFCDLLTC